MHYLTLLSRRLWKSESVSLSHVQLFVTPWTVAHQALLSMGFSRQERRGCHGVGCHSLLQEIFPTQGSNPGLLHCRQILYHLSHQGSHSNYDDGSIIIFIWEMRKLWFTKAPQLGSQKQWLKQVQICWLQSPCSFHYIILSSLKVLIILMKFIFMLRKKFYSKAIVLVVDQKVKVAHSCPTLLWPHGP